MARIRPGPEAGGLRHRAGRGKCGARSAQSGWMRRGYGDLVPRHEQLGVWRMRRTTEQTQLTAEVMKIGWSRRMDMTGHRFLRLASSASRQLAGKLRVWNQIGAEAGVARCVG